MTLTTSYQLVAQVKLGAVYNSNSAYLRVYARYNSQSVANNTSNISIQARLYNESTWWASSGTSYQITASGSLNSGQISCNTSSSNMWAKGEVTLGTLTGNVTHNDDGTRSIHGECRFISSPWGWDFTAQGSDLVLPSIPRYGTSNQSLNSRTETTIKMNWSSDNTVDYLWYSTNNGSSWTGVDVSDGTSGTYTISGLSANTTYNIKTRIRRKDSQLTTDSSSLSVTTYDYPYCTSTPNFTIGNALTLSFYNPLGRSISVKGISLNDSSTIFTGSTTGTSLTGFNDSNSITNQYASIPNSTSSKYKVEVTYGSVTRTRDNSNTYTINVNDCLPKFSNFNYSTNLSELTGNNDTIINGKTTTTITIPVEYKAQGTYSATIKKYKVECESLNTEISYSSSSSVSAVLSGCTSPLIKVIAIDSRGLEISVSKTVTNFKSYSKPSFATTSTERKNGVDTESYLNCQISYWNGNFGKGNNIITSIKYRSKVKTSSSYGSWYDIPLSKLQYNGSQVYLNDYAIHSNGSSGGFSIGIAYDVQIQITDGISTYIFETVTSNNINLTDGKVGFSLLKDNNGDYHCGINGMPLTNSPLALNGVGIIDLLYPVGSVYMSVNSTDPGTLFGVGSWTRITGRFLWATGSTPKQTGGAQSATTGGPSNNTSGGPSNNTSGGSSSSATGSTTLTAAQSGLPSHSHYGVRRYNVGESGSGSTGSSTSSQNTTYYTDAAGGTNASQGHTHPMSHTHSLNSHTHTLSSHTHTVSTMPPYFEVYMWYRTA